MKDITPRDVIILQQLAGNGQNDTEGLAFDSGESTGKILARLNALNQRHLVDVINMEGRQIFKISAKGKIFTSYLWPDLIAAK